MATAPPVAETRGARRTRIWNHVKVEILEVDDDDPLGRHFIQTGINDVGDLLAYTDDTIANMEFNDDTADLPVPRGSKFKIRILNAFYQHKCFEASARVEWTTLSGEAFD